MDPSSNPHLEWLQRRWNLPVSRADLVEKLVRASEQGNTALAVTSAELEGDWGQALTTATMATQEEAHPLIEVSVNGSSYLQSWRDFQVERAIAHDIVQRTSSTTSEAMDASLEQDLEQLFPQSFGNPTAENLQIKATRTALSRNFALITGGPGTGKTYTLARILTLLLRRALRGRASQPGRPLPRIRLAAPTGKAADRMKEAVRESLKDLPVGFSEEKPLLLQAAEGSCTLHSLLGYNLGSRECRHRRDNPLPCEVLIIDEASMIDGLLWKALLEAMPSAAESRLIILGDPFQLESVGSGDVLHQLVSAPALVPAHVQLLRTRRFEGRGDIERLARSIMANDAPRVDALLDSCRDPLAPGGLAWLGGLSAREFWERLPTPITDKLRDVACASTPSEAIAALNTVRILCAHRESRIGAKGVGEMIQRRLSLLGTQLGRPINQPVIINVNDPETGLRNGSVGVICSDAEGVRKAWFPSGREEDPLVAHPVGKLPEHSLAWALTIHRSQGSEFNDILVILPRNESPLSTRELIYTAITRAKRTVFLLGELETIAKAVSDTSRRCTLLGWQIGVRAET